MTHFHVLSFLRLEGLAIALGGLWLYAHLGLSWMLFAALILVPDLFMLGYVAGPRIGALCYNIGHTYVAALALGGAGVASGHPGLQAAGLIWAIHIAADRAIGYGLKYGTHFKHTHLSADHPAQI